MAGQGSRRRGGIGETRQGDNSQWSAMRWDGSLRHLLLWTCDPPDASQGAGPHSCNMAIPPSLHTLYVHLYHILLVPYPTLACYPLARYAGGILLVRIVLVSILLVRILLVSILLVSMRTCAHPTCEHPTCEHPTCEHPTCAHPTCEHRTCEHRTCYVLVRIQRASYSETLLVCILLLRHPTCAPYSCASHSVTPYSSLGASTHPTLRRRLHHANRRCLLRVASPLALQARCTHACMHACIHACILTSGTHMHACMHAYIHAYILTSGTTDATERRRRRR